MSFIRTTVANGSARSSSTGRKLNALDQSMIDEMYQTLLTWGDDDAIETVLVTSTHPRAFCAGGDIRAIRQHALDGEPEAIRRISPRSTGSISWSLNIPNRMSHLSTARRWVGTGHFGAR